MDNALLQAVVSELRERVEGTTLGDIVQIDSRFFALRFSVPPFVRIGISLHPETSALCVLQRVPTPRESTELAGALNDEIAGRPLRSMRKQEAERVVEIEFGGDGGPARVLVVELIGKASNLLLLDAERRILRFLTSHKGAFRRPEAGRLYEAPPPREPAAGEPLGSRVLGRELLARVGRGEPEGEVRSELLERIRTQSWDPTLYTPLPPDSLTEAQDLPAARCFASPFPLSSAEGLSATSCSSAGEAAAAHLMLLRRHLLFRDLRAALVSLLSAEIARMEKLELTLEKEALTASGAEGIRRVGELIMGSLSTAAKEGNEVELIDYFHPEMPKVRIPIDPALDLRGNAEVMFRRARKLSRAVTAIAARRREVALRALGARRFLEVVESAGSTKELEAIESELNRSGAVRKVRRPGRREPGRKPSLMKVKEYRTSDGHTVLVGTSASDNDALTFKVAAPHDFWLHAAGRTGAHVIVRNPDRRKELPERALLEAAAIAAWFSRGDRDSDVEVHVTRRKEVRKGRGMSPGMVMLRAHRTLRVRPAPPPVTRPGGEEES